ncbi:MAG: lipocalin family protein [Fibrobacter sp.]|nr:lipocalin family protein [Fibrobacter sp.]
MKTKILTLLAASTLAFFSACSDDGSSKSITEICADGLSEDCLIGTWTLKSISQKGGEVITDFSAAPGTMTFQDDGIYRYSRSSAGSCQGIDKGEWSISEDGKTLTFYENKDGDCIEFMKHYTTTPSIEVSGNTVTLKLNKVVFQQDESDGMYAGNDTEVFVRTE